MKKIWIFLLICGVNFSLFGQVVSNYTIVLNNDTSPLNATLENSSFIFSFKKSDVLTCTFHELGSGMVQKSVEIISDSKDRNSMIGTFSKTDMQDGKNYVITISFDKLKLNSETNEVYTIIIKDEKEQQNLLKFRLIQ